MVRMKPLSRAVERSLLTLCLLAVPVLGLPVLARPAAAETVVKLASAQNSAGSLSLVLGMQRGLFTAEGIKLEIIDFNGGGPAVQALASGSTDMCICAADHALRLASRGLGGAVLVALTDKHGYALLGKADVPYNSWASLKGQRVGITSPGSLTDNTVRFAISQAGMNPDTDIELIAVGTGGPMRAALDTGAIVAGMFTTPDTQSLLALEGKYKPVIDFRDLDYPALDLVVTGPWLAAHGDTARAVARAVVKAEQMIQTDPTAIRQAMAQMFPKFSPELSEAVAKDQVARGLSKNGIVPEGAYNTLVAMVRTADPSVKAVPYADVVKLQYLP
jgi:NitT/TauT family transport system substrate-binding protein